MLFNTSVFGNVQKTLVNSEGCVNLSQATFLCIRYEIYFIDLAFRVDVALLEQGGPVNIPPGQTKRPGRRSHLPPADLPPLLHPL